jgi:hypothetical protein
MPTCLRPAFLFVFLMLWPSAFILAKTSPWFPPEEAHKAEVTVLARSTSVRTNYSNQDVYLVEVRPDKGESFLGRLADNYPAYQDPLPERLLADDARFRVWLRRDAGCDTTAAAMFFPGKLKVADILARERRSKQFPGGGEMPQANFGDLPIRCFDAVHRSWKYVGHPSPDAWWK